MKAKLKDGTLIAIREESSLYCIVPVETETIAVESIIQKLTNDNLSELQILDDSGTVTQSGINFSVARSTINEGVVYITLRHLSNIEKSTHSHTNYAQLDKITTSLIDKVNGGGVVGYQKSENKYPVEKDTSGKMFVDMAAFLDVIHPVGSIYMSASATNPGTIFGGTWVAWGTGRVPVGVNTSDGNFNTTEKTGGAISNSYTPSGSNAGTAITAAQMPSHNHSVNITSGSTKAAHAHTVGGHTHTFTTNVQSNNHTHNIPALSGTAASSGNHNHTITLAYSARSEKGTNRNSPTSLKEDGRGTTTVWAAAAYGGAHTHSVTTNASNTAGVSTNHTHSGTTAAAPAENTTSSECNHNHSVSGNTGSNGSGNAHTHTFTGTAMNVSTLQPYITCYMWKRTK